MFNGARVFNQPIGSWNTTKVTNMNSMFGGAWTFNQPIGSWNTANVTDMSYMFYGASQFNQPIGLWNTTKVTNMYTMFYNASNFNQPIGFWNTANVTNMESMFSRASAFNQAIGSWNIASITNVYNMLDNSAMDCSNYSATLIGWNANSNTPNNRNLGATGRQYGSQASAAKANLVLSVASGGKGWTITDGGLNPSGCGVVTSSISTPTFTGAAFCAGTNVSISFTTTGTFAGGNQFNILLSDANASFNSPQIIGTTTTAGSVICTIPTNTIGGENYRIKVVSTNPVVSGNDNNAPLTVHPQNWNLVSPTNNVSSGTSTKKAILIINASNSISGVSVVEYKAGKAINLTPGFSVNPANGSSFKINIGACM